mgnify:CR=1 FL=1|jgi:hypothetical protein
MTVDQLTAHEQLVLIGLVKLIVHADQHISDEEKSVLRTLQAAMGDAVWNAQVKAAAEAFSDLAALEQAAQQVEREEAQFLIHEVLTELAGSDEVIPAEAHVLQWIDQTWCLTADELEADDLKEQEDDAAESFVFMDAD